MTKKRKCNWCNETINKSLNDLHGTGWNAVSFDNKISVCSCPKHYNKLKEYISRKLKTRIDGEK